jgi:hypothetical protein
MPCVNPKIEDLLLCSQGDGSVAGVGQYLSLISTNNLTSEPAVAAITETTTNEAYATATGAFTLATGKYFTKFQMLPESANLTIASAGTVGQLTANSTLVFRLPFNRGSYGALKKLMNTPVVSVITNGNEERIAVGSINHPAYVSTVQSRLDKGEAYIELTLTAGPKMPYFTEATIEYAPVT